jgi:PKD repeat protein
MKSILKLKIYGLVLVLATMTGCMDHEPVVEELPNPDVDFGYSVIDESYQLDYYVGATIQFENTSAVAGNCTWEFGDGATATGGTVTYKYPVSGTYPVKLVVDGAGFLTKNIYISDIRPIMTIDPIEGGICEVGVTFINISVDLPNPEGLPEEYTWVFPEGTMNEAGQEVTTFSGKNPGKLKFNHVGSQTLRLQTRLGDRLLEEGVRKVPVGYTEPVPTLYYTIKKGNIMALKLVNNAPAGMKINPFDMGVKSGEHPLNVLFNDQSLYVLDCGKQFTFVDDETKRNQGDGRIFIMSKDGGQVETMLTNGGQYAFDDPYYGYIENGQLYFTDRRTGIAKIDLNERNRILTRADFPFIIENAKIGYYNRGLAYGATNACFGKINGVWYWCKTFNGEGIFRFTDSDVLSAALGSGETAPEPAAGWALKSLHPKSFVWDDVRQVIYFTLWDTGAEGIFRCTLAQLDAITSAAGLAPYKLTMANGKTAMPMIKDGVGEGSTGEYIAVCQLALDRATGAVYFGLRSGDPDMKSGLMRYNPTSGRLEYVVEGVEVYGLAINNTPSKLF